MGKQCAWIWERPNTYLSSNSRVKKTFSDSSNVLSVSLCGESSPCAGRYKARETQLAKIIKITRSSKSNDA